MDMAGQSKGGQSLKRAVVPQKKKLGLRVFILIKFISLFT
jgi:hypothetical protein